MSELPQRDEKSSPSTQNRPAPAEPTRRRGPPQGLGWWLLGLAVIAAAGTWFFWPKPKDPAAGFELVPVQRRTVEARVSATGTLSALVTVQVGSQVSGRIQEILVDYNSLVKKGQVIARLDPQLLQAALERSKANLMAARANVQRARVEAQNARLQAERAKALRAQQFIAQADLDTAEATAQSAQAQVTSTEAALAQAQAALSEAEVNVRYATIVSPTDGMVISRSVDVGQTVAASLQTPTLFTIAEDLRKMQVNTSIAESDVGRLRDGMPATFTVDAWPGQTFDGVIRQIRNAAQTVQNVVTYDAVIDVQNPEMKLKPGMTANVNIVTARGENVLTVPNAALRFRPPAPPEGSRPEGRGGADRQAAAAPPPAGSKTVYVLREGRPVRVNVKAGVTDGSYTEVEGELNEGDQVITALSTAAGTGTGAAPGAGGGQRPAGGGGGFGGGRRGGGPF
ncbi:Macrolide-specific efflux protein MacA [Cystobacter fuscus DSM 2262]|uniref:Macrolide-specific efflux protein MacA n=1 Tax=Cystobacter fuscus (strain ATCC 25194 / DSM 2262 / NBRC 100088 / M29) TaxID=1242864 RepID=S9P994_CYSF2|nr:efflux RND transporter periplasmic adaptor subunit [Cystobacter fuscus]EPX60990.1 Macrolide-specific efflux protein MacA [Cystobacter fuscus DSM 2262]